MAKEKGFLRDEIVELVERLFFEFNKDPQKNKGLANYFYEHLETCMVIPLKRAIETLAQSEKMMPNLRTILTHYRSECPIKDSIIATDCKQCGGDGLIITIYTGGVEYNGGAAELIETTFYTVVNGRCGCVAGEQYISSFPEIAIHPHYIKQAGDEKEWYNYNYVSQLLCTKYNNRSVVWR